MTLSLVEARFDDPTVARLTAASVAVMAGLYGGRHGSGAPPRAAEFERQDGLFLLVQLGGFGRLRWALRPT